MTTGATTPGVATTPGPTGPARTTEVFGDRGAASAQEEAPATAPVRAAAGSRTSTVADDEPLETNEGPFPTPGGGGTGPIDPIYDVERIQRALARRAAGAVRTPPATR